MMPQKRVYLDYAASTPIDSTVLAAMTPFFSQDFGNPSSVHLFGQRAESAVEEARHQIATALNCSPQEIIFTSCGSESDNLALRGAALAAKEQRGAYRILTTPVEHHAISHTAEQLSTLFGFETVYLSVDSDGVVDTRALEKEVDQDVALVSVIYANNEIGTINPIEEIGGICRANGVPFHTDAVQAGAYLPLDVEAQIVDMMSIGAHKFYGPKGIGVLYVRAGTPIYPILTGGGQEFGQRAGTQNVPYIVGMAAALQKAQTERSALTSRLLIFRDRIIGSVLENINDAAPDWSSDPTTPEPRQFCVQGGRRECVTHDVRCRRICLLIRVGLQNRQPEAV